ncbi:MAG: FRG domain-containing protein [Blastomonas sp.]|uniref:FRG domain-containing protein n=1 Tax=Blastomonas sp. TaxID=1909299 RepID=UPI00258CDF40|nr:FRG domain-containing protein [Blastomonas sp.]MCO5793618.1 FRG domain-containing protein [Blastomonas sp.]
MSITSVSEFVEVILQRSSARNKIVSYRGHGSVDFELQPSIFRKNNTKENEHILLRELIAAHPEDFHGDTSALETLVRMQHYSLPTRLLDVTFNPLVALYFACEPAKKRVIVNRDGKKSSRTLDINGQVVILTVAKHRIRYFDSDTVSCLANLSRLSWSHKKQIKTHLSLIKFNETLPIKRLLHFIRQEKYGFLDEIKPSDLDSIILVKPKQNNKRILAQAGAFFVFGLDDIIESGSIDGINVEYLTISAKSKPRILEELDRLGINEKTMFPEIERAARYITGTMSLADSASRVI